MNDQPTGPIFVRGFSRSGGTLTVTLLDGHRAIGMSYELYPNLLVPPADGAPDLPALARALRGGEGPAVIRKHAPQRDLQTFLLRCSRGGLSNAQIADIIDDHLQGGMAFDDEEHHMRFIERCGLAAARQKDAAIWGMKCTNKFEQYLAAWPDARFINVIRDGRDVLASQFNTGSFERSVQRVAEGWSRTHQRFRAFARKAPGQTYELFYERLAHEPEAETRRLFAFLGLPYTDDLLRFHEQDLSIYKTTHLSMDRISKPIDPTRIGRWRQDLERDQVDAFEQHAGPMLDELGYTRESLPT